MKSHTHPLRVAIVGSGPSGFFCADYLLRLAKPCAVALFERWPWPFGLVRDAVAPDKPKIRAAMSAFTRTALSHGFAFRGNVTVGRDISLEELRRHYHAVIIAAGAPRPRPLEIQGDTLPGCVNAIDLAGWYNGRPDCASLAPDLDCKSVVIIGAGNAAMDMARMLAAPPEYLAHTDIASNALAALASSTIRDIHVVARRGPYDVRFAPVELEELARIPGCAVEIHADPAELENAGHDPARKRLLKAYHAAGRHHDGERRVHLHFNLTPTAVLGGEKVSGVLFEDQDQAPVHIPCGLTVVSTGQTGASFPGLPFDEGSRSIPESAGRIQVAGGALPGMYIAGGGKRGANTNIGANKPDCLEAVRSLLEDRPLLESASLHEEEDLLKLLADRGVRVVTFDDWQRLDEMERLRGQAKGKLRDRFLALDEVFHALDTTYRNGGEDVPRKT